MRKKFSWQHIGGFYYAYYGDEELGYIDFYKPWKKWVWNQNEDIIMSEFCIREVLKKLEKITGGEWSGKSA